METETRHGKHFIYTADTQICVQPEKDHVIITFVTVGVTSFITITNEQAGALGEILNKI